MYILQSQSEIVESYDDETKKKERYSAPATKTVNL